MNTTGIRSARALAQAHPTMSLMHQAKTCYMLRVFSTLVYVHVRAFTPQAATANMQVCCVDSLNFSTKQPESGLSGNGEGSILDELFY